MRPSCTHATRCVSARLPVCVLLEPPNTTKRFNWSSRCLVRGITDSRGSKEPFRLLDTVPDHWLHGDVLLSKVISPFWYCCFSGVINVATVVLTRRFKLLSFSKNNLSDNWAWCRVGLNEQWQQKQRGLLYPHRQLTVVMTYTTLYEAVTQDSTAQQGWKN